MWQDPPPAGPGVWVERLEPLKERPGKWALVHVAPTARTAYNIRTELANKRYRIPDGEWAFKARAVKGKGRVFAKYLGPKNEPVAVTTG